MSFKKATLALALSLTAAFGFASMATAFEASLATGLSSNLSSGGRIMAGRDVLALAKDDIDTYRTTGESSEFLKEAVARLAKLNRVSETDVWTDLRK